MYDIGQHIHNFSIWTSARAVQRGFTTTANIKLAVDSTNLRNFGDQNENISAEQFDDFHRKTANTLISKLQEKNVTCSYGQAAKIIAIYFKTSVIIPNLGRSKLSKVIHPPIDN